MKKLANKKQIFLYAMSGIGVNMLNLMMGSYLCSAIIADGFADSALANHTYFGVNLVVIALWSVFGVIAKIIDGVIDIPMAAFSDNLKSRFGRRRPALLIGMVPMIAAYLLFLVVPGKTGPSVLNTVYLGVVLCIFYTFYTLTMVTYYATFTEIVDTAAERNLLSNVKSVCDIVYFIAGYVVVPIMLKGMNVRLCALCVLPLVLTMTIPLFMIHENDNRKTSKDAKPEVNLIESLGHTLKNRQFVIWMLVYSCMQFGVQLFLSGINEYFADTGLSMIFVMSSSFALVPVTLILYTRIMKKHGFGTAYRYILIVYSIGMLTMFGATMIKGGFRTVMAIIAGTICSFAIGAMFSVAYSIPSEIAAREEKRTGVSNSAMYFAVQGLFSGIATAIGSYVVLNALKSAAGKIEDPLEFNIMYLVVVVSAAGTLLSCLLTFLLPKDLMSLGKEEK